jgi:PIN domain nuclease of toxin-antitoxin system
VLLDIAPGHVAAIDGLLMLHSDPFDRILIAQALTEPLRLLTHDVRMVRYSDTVIMV